MSRLPSRGRLKAVAVVLLRLSNSPSTWNGIPVIPAMSARTKSPFFLVLRSISAHAHAKIDSGDGMSPDSEVFSCPPGGGSFATSGDPGAEFSQSLFLAP